MGNSGPSRPHPIYWRDMNIVYFDETTEPEKRIVEVGLSRKDPRQTWHIVLNNDKKTFKLKNIHTNTYLYIGQEHKEGIPEFATIDLDKENYKYDPAYIKLSDTEISNKTDFSFISSFGTQMDIIDRNDNDIKENESYLQIVLQTVKATRVRVTTQMNEYLNIFGVFIYGSDGSIINKDPKYAYSSSIFLNRFPAKNAMKIVRENIYRKAMDAIQNTKLRNKQIGWNNHNNNQYMAHTNNDGGSWWEYEFDDPIDISLIEIFGRTDCCPNRNKLRVDLYDDSVSRKNVIWTTTINDMLYDAHKAVKITN